MLKAAFIGKSKISAGGWNKSGNEDMLRMKETEKTLEEMGNRVSTS